VRTALLVPSLVRLCAPLPKTHFPHQT
jgi:hypothetical protein